MADRVPAGGENVVGQETLDYDVFLSFASADQVAAQRIQATLERGGLRVFWAPEGLQKELGLSFFEAIQHSLIRSRHFVLYWTAHAKGSGWVKAEYEAFFNQCYVKGKGARRLIILPDGKEPISSLPSLLQSLQVARSADDVVGRLAPKVEAPKKEEAKPVPPPPQRVAGPFVPKSRPKGVRVGWKRTGWLAAAVLVATGAVIGYLAYRNNRPPASSGTPPKVVVPPPADPKAPKAGDALAGPLGMRMRFVPSGTYTIGSPEEEPGRDSNETLHQVTLSRGLWLAETELTQSQWQRLIPKQPSSYTACGGDCPVDSINWFEAVEFANRLSDKAGLGRCYELVNPRGTLEGGDFACDGAVFVGFDCPGYRLPTEAEWEVAARAGSPTAIYTGALTLRGKNHGPELFPIAWYGGNSGVSYEGAFDSSKWPEMQFPAARSGPHPVGKKAANKWGVHDLLGNVWEWMGDWYGGYPSGLTVDPIGPPEGTDRVIRGGSWYSDARFCRAAFRVRFVPSFRWIFLGFRLARGQSALQPRGRSPRP